MKTGLSVSIASASARDAAEVASLEQACYSDPWPLSAFAALPDNPDVFFAVARLSGELAGYVIAWRAADEAELANLAVDPAHRRVGVGTQLLDAMLENARHRAINRVYLEVRESNAAARRLYASRGFAEVGRRTRYYRSPEEDALILMLELE